MNRSNDGNDNDGYEHYRNLPCIGVDDRFDAADECVKYTNHTNNRSYQMQINARYLIHGEGRHVNYYGEKKKLGKKEFVKKVQKILIFYKNIF
jgi:hypothetical protein